VAGADETSTSLLDGWKTGWIQRDETEPLVCCLSWDCSLYVCHSKSLPL